MDLVYLADHVTAIPVVARWYYEAWGHADASNSIEATCERIRRKVSKKTLPIHLLAMQKGRPVGVAQLKRREMDIYPQFEFWLGSVFVAPEQRGHGIATRLCRGVMDIAKQNRIRELYLQTASLSGGLYAALGWRPLEQVRYRDVDVLVMCNRLAEHDRS